MASGCHGSYALLLLMWLPLASFWVAGSWANQVIHPSADITKVCVNALAGIADWEPVGGCSCSIIQQAGHQHSRMVVVPWFSTSCVPVFASSSSTAASG